MTKTKSAPTEPASIIDLRAAIGGKSPSSPIPASPNIANNAPADRLLRLGTSEAPERFVLLAPFFREGGHCDIHIVFDTILEKLAVLKTIKPHHPNPKSLIKEFREASKLNNPYLVRYYAPHRGLRLADSSDTKLVTLAEQDLRTKLRNGFAYGLTMEFIGWPTNIQSYDPKLAPLHRQMQQEQAYLLHAMEALETMRGDMLEKQLCAPTLRDFQNFWLTTYQTLLPIPLLQRFFHDACKGLAHIHTRGLLHRDLKPSNIILATPPFSTLVDEPTLKLLDFGIAKAQSATDTTRFQGTFFYSAPDPKKNVASELYSLALIIYELLTGTNPVAKHLQQWWPLAEVREQFVQDRAKASKIQAQHEGATTNLGELLASEPNHHNRLQLQKESEKASFSREFEETLKAVLASSPKQRLAFLEAEQSGGKGTRVLRELLSGPWLEEEAAPLREFLQRQHREGAITQHHILQASQLMKACGPLLQGAQTPAFFAAQLLKASSYQERIKELEHEHQQECVRFLQENESLQKHSQEKSAQILEAEERNRVLGGWLHQCATEPFDWQWGQLIEKQNVLPPGEYEALIQKFCEGCLGLPRDALTFDGGYIIAVKTSSQDWERFRYLQDLPIFSRLTSLCLSFSGIGAKGAAAFASTKHLPNLATLNLWRNQIGDEGAIALANAKHLPNLTTLNLGDNQIGDEGAIALANTEQLPNLTILLPWSNQIGDEGAAAFASTKHLPNLATLNLWRNQIGDEGAIALANAKHLPNLTTLDLSHNQIGDEGAIAFTNARYLPNLTALNLGDNQIGEEVQEALREAFPRATIVF